MTKISDSVRWYRKRPHTFTPGTVMYEGQPLCRACNQPSSAEIHDDFRREA